MKPKPKPIKRKKTKRTSTLSIRKRLMNKLKGIVIEIIFWRDGHQCVQHAQGGCGNGLMWGHYIAQNSSAWLRYDLSNVFVQCGSHNMRDFHGDKSYAAWYTSTFGPACAMALDTVRAEHVNKERTIEELQALLDHYNTLFENRFYVDTDMDSLVQAGYYGPVIMQWWRK